LKRKSANGGNASVAFQKTRNAVCAEKDHLSTFRNTQL